MLSSSLTFFYKFVCFPAWCSILFGMNILIWIETGSFEVFLVVFLFSLFMAAIAYLNIRKIRQISYGSDFVYVKNFRNESKYPLSKVKAINEPSVPLMDPTFELEFTFEKGGIEKFDFMVHIHEYLNYLWSNQIPLSIRIFNKMLREYRESNSTKMRMS